MKKLEIIVKKQTVSEGFYVLMRGHFPNPEFKSILSTRLATYAEAYSLAKTLGNTIALLGNEVREVNDPSAETDGAAYCDHMAFGPLETTHD